VSTNILTQAFATGTGKSYILTILQEVMKITGSGSKIGFTAPTGVAACNIQGMTINSGAGIGVVNDRDLADMSKIVYQVNNKAKQRWRNTDILVIDEISMLSAEIFDLLSTVGGRMRNDPRPFGGVQLVLCGDFFQLPPIGRLRDDAFSC
jgi:ATP-dependent DNA helicase PIF1